MIALLKICTHVELQIGAKHMVLVTFLVFTMVLLSITIRGVKAVKVNRFLLQYLHRMLKTTAVHCLLDQYLQNLRTFLVHLDGRPCNSISLQLFKTLRVLGVLPLPQDPK